jgi:hypothetical protein
LLHLVPESSKRGAAFSVLDVTPGKGALDAAGAFPFLTRENLEVAVEVLFDPNGKLGHGL